MKLKQIFEAHGIDFTHEIQMLLKESNDTIIVPNKTEAKLNYITKTELKNIHEDEQTAKELILIILSNFSDTFYKSKTNYATEEQRDGYKVLNAEILSKQVKIQSKVSSPYKAILTLLTKYDIIEKGRSYSTGNRSNEYRLTKTYFGKGTSRYHIKTASLRNKHQTYLNNNLSKVLSSTIGTKELLNRGKYTFPTQEEAKEYLIKLSKEGKTNKRGKKIVYLNKRNPKDFEDCVFVEDYLQILEYLQKIVVPMVISENGGNRVITSFNFLPSVLRPLVKFQGDSLVELDFQTLHPNIVQYIYGGSNTKMITHDIVANYLGITRQEAKIEHLSFFNKHWKQMSESPLFKYYVDNETMMMQNIYHSKRENGYKQTSKDCFYFETELMSSIIKELDKLGIQVCYCFDALFVAPQHKETVKEIMNHQADMFGLLTRTN